MIKIDNFYLYLKFDLIIKRRHKLEGKTLKTHNILCNFYDYLDFSYLLIR